MSAAWKVSDLDADLSRLSNLLGVICEIRFNLPAGEDDERVDGLLWIAREMSDGIVEYQNKKYGIVFDGEQRVSAEPLRMTGGERNG